MMRLKLMCLLFGLMTVVSFSQSNKDAILFTVDDEPVYAKEFLRVYFKNLDLVKDESQKDIDEYLKLFINYKLKLKEAKALEFDKKPQYIREFENYRKQLAQNYLTDRNVTEAIVEEAYDRISYDVKASHILIRLPEFETDTVQVYNQIQAFRDRLLTEDFETIKKDSHNGESVFVEDLGWFSGFKMVYPFETAAFTTPVGEVSEPFRTQFGFHVVKVFDKRKSRGEVTVGHIMITNKKDSVSDPEQRINEIYKLIQQGENFESLAKQFSEDKSSAKNGGKLSAFKSGQLSSVKFEDKAFSLEEPGEISEPFQTDYGWHIAKLYDKKGIEPFEVLKPELELRIKRDSRSKVIRSKFIDSLKQRYQVNADVDLSYFVSLLDESFFLRNWSIPEGLPQDKPFFNIKERSFNYYDFASYIQSGQKKFREKQSYESAIATLFDQFVSEKLMQYHEDKLEDINEEYAFTLSEYRDGLLLFDLMQTKIWDAAKNDSLALKDYYEKHKSNYTWPERIDAIVATGHDRSDVEAVKTMFENNMTIDAIQNAVDSNEKQNIIFTTDIMTADHQALPASLEFKEGTSSIQNYNDAYHVIHIREVLPASIKTFEDARGNVISDYQTHLENEWLQKLKSKYQVKMNDEVLKDVKKEIQR